MFRNTLNTLSSILFYCFFSHILPYFSSPSPLRGLLEGLLPSLPSSLPVKWKVFEPRFVRHISFIFQQQLFMFNLSPEWCSSVWKWVSAHTHTSRSCTGWFKDSNQANMLVLGLQEGTRAPGETHSAPGRTCRVHREADVNVETSRSSDKFSKPQEFSKKKKKFCIQEPRSNIGI